MNEELRKCIFDDIDQERKYQEARWGNEADKTLTFLSWHGILNVYLGNSIRPKEGGVFEENVDLLTFRENMIKVAAVAVASLEATDHLLQDVVE